MEAYLYEKHDPTTVKCNLCHHRCLVKDGKKGICNVRENRSGVLTTMVYGRLIAQHVDPIEKKPLFHLIPASRSYSVATVGCNFKCRFCQNASIAQMPSDHGGRIAGEQVTPAHVVAAAQKTGCTSIAYTYTEPTIYFEFACDTAKLAHEKGIKNVFVTNGYMTPEALRMISPWLDAANVDLKAFNNDFYRKYCGAKLSRVKETLELMKQEGIFLEITTLLIPELNDDRGEIRNLATFIKNRLGSETPWHISRFHPTYKLTNLPPTPLKTILEARKTGMEIGLKYVYTGNVPGEEGENTFCPGCGIKVIQRWGFQVKKNLLENGYCPDCGSPIEGIWL
jgi:pyruvate formate lyase activating enzyme